MTDIASLGHVSHDAEDAPLGDPQSGSNIVQAHPGVTRYAQHFSIWGAQVGNQAPGSSRQDGCSQAGQGADRGSALPDPVVLLTANVGPRRRRSGHWAAPSMIPQRKSARVRIAAHG